MKAANSNNLCPICKKNPAETKYHPFCSARCADVDMGRWLKGNYTIPEAISDFLDRDENEASNPTESL